VPHLLKAEFEYYYGNDNESLPDWQKLCRVRLINPVADDDDKYTLANTVTSDFQNGSNCAAHA
jgi:hypothetical protein